MLFCPVLIFSKSTFSKKKFRKTISVKQFGSRSGPTMGLVRTACKFYQLSTLVSKGSNVHEQLSIVKAHPAISHCGHLLLKCRVATNISHWLKVQSWWFKNYIFAKKCILISFWIFKYCFYYSFTLYHCAIFYSLGAGFFQYHPAGCQTAWIQIGPDILSGLICVQTVCKGYQLATTNSESV